MPRIMLVVMAIGMGVTANGVWRRRTAAQRGPPVKRSSGIKVPALKRFRQRPMKEPYTYDASNRRDPFKPLIATDKAD